MIKLILLRIFPMVAAVGIVGGALSPVSGTIEAFGAAADALTGKTDIKTEGITVDTGQLPSAITGIEKPKQKAGSGKKQSLQALAEKLDKGQPVKDGEENYGWEAGDRAMKPLEPPPKKK